MVYKSQAFQLPRDQNANKEQHQTYNVYIKVSLQTLLYVLSNHHLLLIKHPLLL
ncbi:hypothetical protein CHCC15381_4152 [Bacillus paralicheniformis]|uniref:Uncharacterized protein n=1 Tax=Bacillus paralicheniformis TaxID=1648923 RepID=A0ABY3FWS7_9BACI|nr:hypothetical protein CHCC15381_4152 [Bacillus paralicheniformis]